MKLRNTIVRTLVLAGAALLMAGSNFAQVTNSETGANRAKTLVGEWQRAKLGTQEFIDAMPEANLGFKPTPEIRSFAEQMLHVAGGNFGFGAAASGKKNPYAGQNLEKLPDVTTNKAALRKLVMESYDFIIECAQSVETTKLDEEVAAFGGAKMTRSLIFAKGIEHHAHHRGQTVIYLRLKGITPPSERLF